MSTERQKLRIGFQNINWVEGKLPDVSVYLNKSTPFQIFGIAETRFTPSVSDTAVSIPNYTVFRRDRDKSKLGQVGLAVYIHDSVRSIARRREDLETEEVECIWIELKDGQASPLLICFFIP